jgi:hypothetical protein
LVYQLKIRLLHPFLQVAFQIFIREVVAFLVFYQLFSFTLKLLIRPSSNMPCSFFLERHGRLCLLFLVCHANTEGQWVLAVFLGLLTQLFACRAGVGLGRDLSCALGPRPPNAAPAGFFFLVLCCLQHLKGVRFVVK